MNRLLDSISVVGHTNVHGYPAEVCALTEAEYDAGHHELVVLLDSFVRGVDLNLPQHREKAVWLPRAETVHEHVAFEEASELSHEVAKDWRRRVRESVPMQVQPK
jgi:hypothetical protein